VERGPASKAVAAGLTVGVATGRIPVAQARDDPAAVLRASKVTLHRVTMAALFQEIGFFQIGTTRFSSSINHWQAARVSPGAARRLPARGTVR
jgi:hypothetical protein